MGHLALPWLLLPSLKGQRRKPAFLPNPAPFPQILIDKNASKDPNAAPQALSMADPQLQTLHKEARLMSQLNHPNIVTLIGVVKYPAAIVTSYCERGSLASVIHEARRDPLAARELSWQRRLQVAVDAAVGCNFMHNKCGPPREWRGGWSGGPWASEQASHHEHARLVCIVSITQAPPTPGSMLLRMLCKPPLLCSHNKPPPVCVHPGVLL